MDKRKAIEAELPGLRRYARALQGNSGAADDLVQDSVERALSRLHQFRDGTDMRAWLFTILHSVHANAMRRRSRAVDSQAIEAGNGAEGVSPPSQDDGLEIRDLARSLADLSDEQRQVVLLVGLEGMSYREVAEVLEIPVGTVMSRLARGRERLRRLMGGETPSVPRRVK